MSGALPVGFTLDPRGAVAIATTAPGGGYLINGKDYDKAWKNVGAKAVDLDGRWFHRVEDLTTLVRCAQARGPLRVTEEVADHLARRDKHLEASRASDSDLDIPAPEGLKYLGFQRAGIAYAKARRGVLFGDEMGLGKTIQLLGLINASKGAIRSALVTVPASLRLNWLREARKWLLGEWRFWVADDSGKTCPDRCNFAIINYDRLHKHPELWSREWGVVAADEAHYAKNRKARRTRWLLGGPAIPAKEEVKNPLTGEVIKKGRAEQPAVTGIVERGARKVLMTGTPLLNRPIELYTIAHALAPSSFPSENSFKRRYCGGTSAGASNLDELQEKMRAAFMVRRLKKDVLTDLPPKVRQVVTLPIDDVGDTLDREQRAWDSQEEKLDELRADVVLAKASGDDEEYKRAVSRLRAGERIAFTEISKVRHETALVKVPYVLAHLRQLIDEGAGKLLLFAHHRDVLEQLREGLKDQSPMFIAGDTPMEARQAAVDRFQNDASCRLAVLSITAAGVGLTLTASSTVVFAELDWVPGNVTQAEDRAHRIGQRDSVHVLHLVFDGSLDSKMAKTLVEKQELAEMALDRKADPAKVAEMMQRTALPASREPRESLPKVWPEVPPNDRAMVHDGLRILAGTCDGANRVDGAGFNKMDARVGHDLAARAQLTNGQAYLAARLCRKYKRQVGEAIAHTAEQILATAPKPQGMTA